MLNLNNRGMAVSTFISGIVILIMALVIIAILSPHIKSLNGNYLSGSIHDISVYKSYENEVYSAAKRFIGNNNYYIDAGSEIILNINQLAISSDIRIECSGYVKVSMVKVSKIYQTYLKCDSYVSDGYDSKLDR
jgi:hypothetical protein